MARTARGRGDRVHRRGVPGQGACSARMSRDGIRHTRCAAHEELSRRRAGQLARAAARASRSRSDNVSTRRLQRISARALRGTARALAEDMSNNTRVVMKSLAITSALVSGLASGSAFATSAPNAKPSAQARASNSPVVTVPPNYVYSPERGWLHDYCSAAPDEFPAPVGPKADFRGPCARHDMCLEAHKVPAQVCHGQLRNDLITNCNHWYGWNNPLRYSCTDVAGKYWAAVTAWSRVPHP